MPIEPPEIPPANPSDPTEPPPENPPGNPRPEVPPPVHEPGEPPRPDELPGKTPDEPPGHGPSGPRTPNDAAAGTAYSSTVSLGTAGNNGLMPASPQRITFAEMRAADIFGVLVYCTDYRCITPLLF